MCSTPPYVHVPGERRDHRRADGAASHHENENNSSDRSTRLPTPPYVPYKAPPSGAGGNSERRCPPAHPSSPHRVESCFRPDGSFPGRPPKQTAKRTRSRQERRHRASRQRTHSARLPRGTQRSQRSPTRPSVDMRPRLNPYTGYFEHCTHTRCPEPTVTRRLSRRPVILPNRCSPEVSRGSRKRFFHAEHCAECHDDSMKRRTPPTGVRQRTFLIPREEPRKQSATRAPRKAF